jgi:hypothetical protein
LYFAGSSRFASMKKRLPLLASISLAFLLYACIDPYETGFEFDNQVLVVDGFITDAPVADTIRINLATSNSFVNDQQPIENATVSIIVKDGATVQLRSAGKGRYYTPQGFRGQVGKSYKLKFNVADRGDYESNFQTLSVSPSITKIYEKFDPKGILDATGTKTFSANLVYIDFKDPANERNYYLWRYTHWERLDICATCEGGTYIKSIEACLKSSSRFAPTYDYLCEPQCWTVIYSNKVISYSDANSDGLPVAGQQIAKIPMYSSIYGCLVEVQQYSISADAYRFFKVLEGQTQSSGGLTDTPPAPLVGNIKNLSNSTEAVVGYFCASGIQTERIFIDRKNVTGTPINLLGRDIRLEPSSQFATDRPPSARCFEGPNRTAIRPRGWIQ